MIVLAPDGHDARRFCPVHGQCLCGGTHALTLSALWCFQAQLSMHARRPLCALPPELVIRWLMSTGQAPRWRCSGCTEYPALWPLTQSLEEVIRATAHGFLIGPCTAPDCENMHATFNGVRMNNAPHLDAVHAGDDRLRCADHKPRLEKR